MSGVDVALELRRLRGRCVVANALPVALCHASDTRSQALIERSTTP